MESILPPQPPQKWQPVSNEGFVCPDDTPGPACPAWGELVSLVRSLQPDTLIVPGPDGCLVNAEQPGGTYPIYYTAPQGMCNAHCMGLRQRLLEQ
jgi:hypothetical protein